MVKSNQTFNEYLKDLNSSLPDLQSHGWKLSDTGHCHPHNFNEDYYLFIRSRNLGELIKSRNQDANFSQRTSICKSADTSHSVHENPVESNTNLTSRASLRNQNVNSESASVSPIAKMITAGCKDLPELSDFRSYPSLQNLSNKGTALVIGYDSEWIAPEDCSTRTVLSWQFACIQNGHLHEFIFIRRKSNINLNLNLAIGNILDYLNFTPIDTRKITQYSCLEIDDPCKKIHKNSYKTFTEASKHSSVPYDDNKYVHRTIHADSSVRIPIVLVCHAGKGDISALDCDTNLLRHCTEVQGGLITLKTIHSQLSSVHCSSCTHASYIYPISLNIADTMCHAPAKSKSLKDLGNAINWNKIQLEDGVIKHMNSFLNDHPADYFEYASNDSVVALLYSASLYGYNNAMPVTITSATANVMCSDMKKYLNCKSPKEFDLKYRGLRTVNHGLAPKNGNLGYIASTSKEPISDKAHDVQYYCSQAYHGGYNSCPTVGYFPFETFDYDLRNAYPTAMTLILDVNWDSPYRDEMLNRPITLDDFRLPLTGALNPLTPMVGYISFIFPDDVKYPCIPTCVDGVPIFPKSSNGEQGVYACGPEIYLALKLGAKVICHRGFVINPLTLDSTGAISYSLRSATKQLVSDRNKAKAEHGKGSIEELTLKTMINSGYGKVSQSVIQKQTWSAYENEMIKTHGSPITNPFSACMITSIVRAELIATQNQCSDNGYMTCSVTTDGFISDAPENFIKSLDLYGFRPYIEQARLYLTDNTDPELWEAKHHQTDLVNFTTRGNVSLSPHGVCAHNSTKSGYPSDSYADRLWLMTTVLARTGKVAFTTSEWTEFKRLVNGAPFTVKQKVTHASMDYDFKRKPLKSSFRQCFCEIDGISYEIANFDTIPYADIAEFTDYRRRAKSFPCLRTISDWAKFWIKDSVKESTAKVRDMNWAILNSTIMGYRAGLWNITMLDKLSGQDRCDWINSHNNSNHVFSLNDWKHAGLASRQSSMLPQELLKKKLSELQNDNQEEQ